MTPAILIVADDLTGASDSAVAFAQRGYRNEVVIDWHDAANVDAEVVALTTESRDADARELAGKLSVLASRDPRTMLFKKIDSMVRGNTFAEIEIACGLLPCHTVIISPAYPRLGRVCINGSLHWNDGSGQGAIDLSEELRRRGIPVIPLDANALSHWPTASMQTDGRAARRVFLHDAATDDDLLQIARAGLSLTSPVLWIGSGGLAHALAAQLAGPSRLPAAPELEAGTALLFVGSDHPVTQRQLRQLRSESSTGFSLITVNRGITTAAEISAAVSRIEPDRVSFLFMTGGDTAMLVCKALGVRSLNIQSEFAPGVPMGRLRGGVLNGVPVLLKSGGFGEPDLLCRMCNRVRNSGRLTA